MDTLISRKTLFDDTDISLLNSGKHFSLYEKLGSHRVSVNGEEGVCFAVWAPNAQSVSVMGDFNLWDNQSNFMVARPDNSGIWEAFIPGVKKGAMYKYFIASKYNNYKVEKRDPFSFFCEVPPQRASIVWDLEYDWQDALWMEERKKKNAFNAPISIYEMHFGSWKRIVRENNRFPLYNEMADSLIRYLKETGFTHVEFMPLTAHPLYESWGYQTDGYFAPTSRYGTPQDLMRLIDRLHQNDIGVILDWVPSHFPLDKHGLSFFDGTYLFEHADPKKGFHPEWKSAIFNYGRKEVVEFLISSALFWLDKYHADGIRVDGGTSMLYLDYSRKKGEWIPNQYGGRENLEAVSFLKQLNEAVNKEYPDCLTFIEEATAWPKLSHPVFDGGLGFSMKWNMGWMHDTLKYLAKHPDTRKHHHKGLHFSLWYAFNENFILPLSHDEVVHAKGSLIRKMPGDNWQKFGNLRLLFGFMFAHPGKKLLFMGGEFGQWAEWNQHASLDWHLLDYPLHKGMQKWVADLNFVYKNQSALHEKDFTSDGFEWIDYSDWQQSVISFIRKENRREEDILIVCNFTPVPRFNYRIGVPAEGYWGELLNSNAKEYGGEGMGNMGGVSAEQIGFHGRPYSLSLTLPPLSVLYFKRRAKKDSEADFSL
ncbi:MAG: 1,4-alpha-glucan branching protein GlgB [Candidatus Omnitrophica bacterium]|nr:1,4-alpha-glucan branching protein GlgB [Candidatus Omnitrophota bacterium]